MEKMIFICLIGNILLNVASASQQIEAKKTLSNNYLEWTSKNSNDIISIESGADENRNYNVQIFASACKPHQPVGVCAQGMGINIKNCGNVIHINPGSSAICSLNQKNPMISFSSENNYAAYGIYQIF